MQWFFSSGHDLLSDDNSQFSYDFFLGKHKLMNNGDSISLQYHQVTVNKNVQDGTI